MGEKSRLPVKDRTERAMTGPYRLPHRNEYSHKKVELRFRLSLHPGSRSLFLIRLVSSSMHRPARHGR